MKKSIFEKEFFEKGVNGTVAGKVIVEMNYKSASVPTHNPSTHDDGIKTRWFHSVKAQIGNEVIKEWAALTDENEVYNMSKKAIESLNEELKHRANTVPEKSFLQKMQDLFK